MSGAESQENASWGATIRATGLPHGGPAGRAIVLEDGAQEKGCGALSLLFSPGSRLRAGGRIPCHRALLLWGILLAYLSSLSGWSCVHLKLWAFADWRTDRQILSCVSPLRGGPQTSQ